MVDDWDISYCWALDRPICNNNNDKNYTANNQIDNHQMASDYGLISFLLLLLFFEYFAIVTSFSAQKIPIFRNLFKVIRGET